MENPMTEVVIVAATRTAIGSFGGSLASVPAVDLGACVISSLMEKTGVAADKVDEVIMGHVLTAGCGQNTARQAAIKAGLADTTSAMTINKVCGSGLKALHLGAQAIACGDASIVVAGGQESMSLSAHVLPNSRNGQRMGDWNMVDTMIVDGLWDAFNDFHMGITAENVGAEYSITREEQDTFAAASQAKALAAIEAGTFKEEITPVKIPQRRGEPVVFDTDENPRAGVTFEKLSGMRPAFKKDGCVTAGNASSLNDGAAAVMLASREVAEEMGLPILATIKAHASAGVDPKIMGTGPIPATKLCLEKAGWTKEDLDLVEANEAFAVQALSVNKGLEWDADKINVNGGAIALGHPLGCSGARISTTLINVLEQEGGRYGVSTMCIGLGQGIATVWERL
jgi:acetyl-CoA C-acetyltransferase